MICLTCVFCMKGKRTREFMVCNGKRPLKRREWLCFVVMDDVILWHDISMFLIPKMSYDLLVWKWYKECFY